MRLSCLFSYRMLRILPVIGLLAGKPLMVQNGPALSVQPYGTNSVQIRGTPGNTTPPNPALVASALAPNVYNPFGPATAFLYTGANPIQIGVAPGTIQPVQAAVLRGTVTARDNTPLPGVRVALLNHPKFGYTYTRTNGMFDMAVNAAQYTVDFEGIGYFRNLSVVEDMRMTTGPDLPVFFSFMLSISEIHAQSCKPDKSTLINNQYYEGQQ